MGMTRARQYQCDLCPKMELVEREQPPPNWLEVDKRVACDACVDMILNGPLKVALRLIDANCARLPNKDNPEGSFHHHTLKRMVDKAVARVFAAEMLRVDAEKIWQECEVKSRNARGAVNAYPKIGG